MLGVVIIPFVLDVRLVNAPTGVTQEEGRTGFIHLASVVLAFIFVARMIQPSLSLVDREVKFVYPRINRSPLVGHLFFRPFLTRKFFQEILGLEGSQNFLGKFRQVHNLKISDRLLQSKSFFQENIPGFICSVFRSA